MTNKQYNSPKGITPQRMSLWTRKDVAEFLNVSTETVKRYQRDGKLAAVIQGHRTIRYRPEDVMAFIDNRLMQSTV